MKKFFALLLSACLFISCGINDFSKKSSVSFTIPKEALQQIQQEASRSITISEEYIDSQIKSFIEYAKESGEELSEKYIEAVKASLQEKILYEPFINASTIVIYSQIIGSKGTKFVSSNEIPLENKVQLTDDQEIPVSEMGESDFDTRGDFDVEETYGLPTEVTDEVNTDTYKNFSDLEITFNNLPTNETYTVKVDIFVERDYETSWVYTGDTNNIKLEKDKNDIVVEMFQPDAKEDNPSVFYIKDNGKILNIDRNDYHFVLKEDGTKNKEDAAQTNISYKLYYYTGTEENFETFYEDEWTEVYVVINDRFSDFEQNKIGYGYDWWNDIYLKTSFNFIPDSENEYYYPFYIDISGIIYEFKTKDEPTTDYNPISKYFDLIINKAGERCYPTVKLKEDSGLSPNSIDCYDIFISGENTQVDTDTLSTSKDSSYNKSNFGYFNVVNDATQTFTVSFAVKIDGTMEYFSSQIIRNITDDLWFAATDSDSSLKVIDRTKTSGKIENKALIFMYPYVPDLASGEPVVETSSNVVMIPLQDLGISELTSNDTVLFHVVIDDDGFSLNETPYIFYRLATEQEKQNFESTTPTNQTIDNYYYSNCISLSNLYNKKTYSLTVDLPIETNEEDKTYNYLMINLQNVKFPENDENFYQLSPTITFKKFNSNDKIFTISYDSTKQLSRYELQIPLDNSTFDDKQMDSKYSIKFSGYLKTFDVDNAKVTNYSLSNKSYVHLDIFKPIGDKYYISYCNSGGTTINTNSNGMLIDDSGKLTIDTQLTLSGIDNSGSNESYYLQIYIPYDNSGKILYFDEFEYGNTGAQVVFMQQD